MTKEMKQFQTKCGLVSYEQAKKFGLVHYYDEMMGCYLIPVKEVNKVNKKAFDPWKKQEPTLMQKIFSLLSEGRCFCKDGTIDTDHTLAMEVIEHYEDGNLVEGEYDLWIREVEIFK